MFKVYKEFEKESNKVKKYLTETKHYGEVLFIGLRGSRHLNTVLEDSDYDFTAIVMPDIRNLVFKEKAHQSASHDVSSKISVQVTTLQGISQTIEKMSFNIFEMFTMLTYVNPKVKKLMEKIYEVYNTEEAKEVLNKNLYFTGVQQYKRLSKDLPNPEKALAKAILFRQLLELDSFVESYIENKLPSPLHEEFMSYRTGKKTLGIEKEMLDKYYYPTGETAKYYLSGLTSLPKEKLKDVEKEVYKVLKILFEKY